MHMAAAYGILHEGFRRFAACKKSRCELKLRQAIFETPNLSPLI